MDSRICKQCGEDKSIDLFRGGRRRCKKCDYEFNRENTKRASKAFYQKNKEKIKALNEENKEEIRIKNKDRYQKNKESVKQKVKEYRVANKEKVIESAKKYYEKNRDCVLAYHKEYRDKNRDKRAAQKREYEKNRMIIDPAFRLRKIVRNAVYCAILRSGSKKSGSILDHLPYSMDELKKYIESLFEPWMNWDNWGIYDPETWSDEDQSTWTWNIDHITRQADLAYDSFSHPNFHKCWALKNLRPYSSKINIEECHRRKS